MTFRIWFDRVAGTILIIFGLAMMVPAAFLLLSPLLGLYTVGLTPPWLRYALIGIAMIAPIQIVGGVNMIRLAGNWG